MCTFSLGSNLSGDMLFDQELIFCRKSSLNRFVSILLHIIALSLLVTGILFIVIRIGISGGTIALIIGEVS